VSYVHYVYYPDAAVWTSVVKKKLNLMKIIVASLLTALLAFVAGIYLPWWSLAIAAFIGAILVQQSSGRSFLAGFLGIFLLWALLAWWIDWNNNSYLSQKIASLLPLSGNSLLLILVTAFIGGLVGGSAALTGSFLRPVDKRLA
jgi:hypothetical protein